MTPAQVIFACVHNAGRSQMAAAFFNRLSAPRLARAVSAGTQPGERVHPEVLAAMKELGIDLSGARPQKLTDELARGASMLITMGCGDACPYVPGLSRDDWPLTDPKGKSVEQVRAIRDEVEARVEALLDAKGWAALTVRQAQTPDELEQVRGLFREYQAHIGVDLCFQSFDQELAALPGDYAAPRGLLWLASVEGEVQGCVALRPLSEGACELKRLYVRPALHGRGLGRALARKVVAQARALGYRAVRLDTLPMMTSALRLYRSLGFREIAPYTANPVQGALFFELSLGG